MLGLFAINLVVVPDLQQAKKAAGRKL